MRGNDYCDATGSQRRLQALVAMGWPAGFLASEMSLAPVTVRKIMTGKADRITQLTVKRVSRVYDRYSMQPAPAGIRFDHARMFAQEHGWVSSLAWDDDVIDDPAATPNLTGDKKRAQSVDEIAVWRFMSGDFDLELNRLERLAVCERWERAGRSREDLARVTGWNVWRMMKRAA